jgi:hypothetical protein
VNEYVTKFTQLSRYSPHEVDTDEKKHECFLNVLNDGLTYALDAQDFENFQGMVNKALMLENHRGVMEHKCKLVCQHQPGSSSRPCVATSSARPVFRPAQPQFQPKPRAAGQGFSTPQRQVNQRPSNFQTPVAGNQSVQRIQVARNPLQGERKCYACGARGHFTNKCPNPHIHPPQTAVSTPTLTHGANSDHVATKQNYAHEKLNHVSVEEARKLQTWSLVCFSSMTLWQLCCLILEHRILSYPLHMLRSIICP